MKFSYNGSAGRGKSTSIWGAAYKLIANANLILKNVEQHRDILVGEYYNLVKGDLERMKKEIDTQEYAKFQKDSTIFTVLFIALLIVPIPLVMLWKWFGMALYLCLFGIGMYFAVRIEKYKKKYDIQTFKEIVAFTDGKSLDEIEKAREEGKRPYQKALLVAGSAALAVIIALIMTAVMRLFS